ncbi:UvrD-helicase domain-containing protein [Pseudovibrio sp. Ad37]|uniref:UvrD-helicase domain-containing protein n=1 Tax=Pseudovibrio sp. Ad37 TaxID=989422 RepID=UPI0007AE40CE|nr:UvrD-helicase domain-containing protein [Pseudovibrio sp. Ad37]KZL24257.1 putative ATP-dependent DNA helicase YjcD [Pseudovibrio sp. Ad37]
MKVTDEQRRALDAEGHCLVLGGPGAGKTTISIMKAAAFVEAELKPEQHVLFLSFARATVSRVSEGIARDLNVPKAVSNRIEVDTYHSFFWRILKGHGYLLGLPHSLELLLPADVAGVLSELRTTTDQSRDDGLLELTDEEKAVLQTVAFEDGRIGFDLFAPLLADLLTKFPTIGDLVANRYPLIILDEFQDTSDEQWEIVKRLGSKSRCLALADPDQRIFDFIATDPERSNHFIDYFEAEEIDLGGLSHRNLHTDITLFGDDILRGTFSQLAYEGVDLVGYPRIEAQAHTKLITEVMQARKRAMKASGEAWSVAVLVPTKPLTKKISDLFTQGLGKMPLIPHTAVIERDAAILSAHCIGVLLEKRPVADGFERFVLQVASFYRGRSGSSPAKGHLKTANSFVADLQKRRERQAIGKDLPANSKMRKMEQVYKEVLALSFTGDPQQDWVMVRNVLEKGCCVQLRDIAEEARNLRFLDRGKQLRLVLSEDWDGAAAYPSAFDLTKEAFVQEHFAMAGQPEGGVVIMNLHKAKGKQFDETILFEDMPIIVRGIGIVRNSGRFVRENEANDNIAQYRKNFRMAVTRSKYRTTVLTPKQDKCILVRALM